ncbi:MAG: type IV pilus twitching motility protein PilT [Myxococcota bacterium]
MPQMRIDFYVQNLVRHGANGIELVSGQPVRFRFPDGDRHSNKPIEHAQLTHLVREAAPADAFERLRRDGQVRFVHSGDAGRDVEVHVVVDDARTWKVELQPTTTTGGEGASRASIAGEAAAAVPQEEVAAGKATGAQASAPPAAPQVQAAPGEPRINQYLRVMKKMGASDLHLSTGVVPMIRFDGEMQPLGRSKPLASDQLAALLDEIMTERNRKEFEETSDTDFAHAIEGVARFRVNAFRDIHGVGVVFRQIPYEIMSPEKLGIPKPVLDLCWLSKGLVVVTGPTGSGKSTTLATLIDYINRNRSDHIITIEDPIEFVHQNKKCLVNQREVGTHTQSFKKALRAALREDPDIVLVGEMRDLETIAIAIETAETGHLVFGTLHTTTAMSTVDRIIDQFPADQQSQIRVMLSESLRGVIAQVLCKKNGGGRVAGYEVLISNPAVANLIREGKTHQLASAMQTGKNLGMQTMNEHLMRFVQDGVVTAEEAYVKSNDKLGFKDLLSRHGIALNLGG